MPLGDARGSKSSSARFCGVETVFEDDVPNLFSVNLHGGFDFLVVPLVSSLVCVCVCVSSHFSITVVFLLILWHLYVFAPEQVAFIW